MWSAGDDNKPIIMRVHLDMEVGIIIVIQNLSGLLRGMSVMRSLVKWTNRR